MRSYYQRRDALFEYQSIFNDFCREPNEQRFGRRLQWWKQKYGIQDDSLYRYQMKVFRRLK